MFERYLKPEYVTVLKFCIVGGTGLLINLFFTWLFTDILSIYYVISATIAIELSILNNFTFNHIWTFGHVDNPQPIWKKLLFFEAISSVAVVMQIVTMYLFTEYLHIYYLISLMIAIPITVAWNYLANKHFTWKQ